MPPDLPRSSRSPIARACALPVVLSLAAACYSPNSYVPARTLEPGVAWGGGGFEGHGGGDTAIGPSLFFALRRGVSERADLGLRVVPDLRGDARLNFVRSDIVDMTIAPTLWFGWMRWLATITRWVVPPAGAEVVLQTDLRFGADASLATQVGAGYAVFPPSLFELIDESGADDPYHGVIAHAGIGLYLRASRTLVIHPQASLILMTAGWDDPSAKLVIGLAFWRPH